MNYDPSMILFLMFIMPVILALIIYVIFGKALRRRKKMQIKRILEIND